MIYRLRILRIVASSFLLAIGASNLAAQHARREFQLQAESPQFWDLIDHEAKLSVMGTGFGFTEGPVWDEAGLDRKSVV